MDNNITKNSIGYYKHWLMENLKTPADILPLCNQMVTELLNPYWGFKLSTRSTKWLGVCRPAKRLIEINSNFVRDYFAANRELVVNTILHEFAHAECHLYYPGKRHGHGDMWDHFCWVLGLSPEARRAKVTLDPSLDRSHKWQLVNTETGERYRKYLRRPRTDISQAFIKGRPETKGKLAFVPINREQPA